MIRTTVSLGAVFNVFLMLFPFKILTTKTSVKCMTTAQMVILPLILTLHCKFCWVIFLPNIGQLHALPKKIQAFTQYLPYCPKFNFRQHHCPKSLLGNVLIYPLLPITAQKQYVGRAFTQTILGNNLKCPNLMLKIKNGKQ